MNDYEKILKEAQENNDIIGLILVGSRGKGFENEYSDYDLIMIIKDEASEILHKKYEAQTLNNVDLATYSFSDFKILAGWESPESWDSYSYAHVKMLVDKTGGELEKIVQEKGQIPQDKLNEFIDKWLDGYINGVYRSVKCFRNGNLFGAQLEASNSILDLLTVVFAMNGRHRPFLDYIQAELETYPLENLPWSSVEFVEKIKIVLATAKLEVQQELLRGLEKMSRETGHGQVFDDWKGKDKWTMDFKVDN